MASFALDLACLKIFETVWMHCVRHWLTSVSGLFCSCGPAAIPRRVRTVVVDSLKSVRRARFVAHLANERGEIVAPQIAHFDSPSAIVLVGRTRLRVAAAVHSCPSLVFRSCCRLLGVTMTKISKAQLVVLNSRAAARSAASSCLRCELGTAIAPDVPIDRAARAGFLECERHVSQTTLPFSGSVASFSATHLGGL